MNKEIESWKDGIWYPNSKIGTGLWDAHYFFGYAVFDAFRTYNHIPHMMWCHINRLYNSAELTGINILLDKNELVDVIHKVMDHNKDFFKDDEYRFMIFASPGYFKIYKDMGDTTPSVTVNVTTVSRYATYVYPYLDKGVTSVIVSQKQIPYYILDSRIKSCSRLQYGLADKEAQTVKEDSYPVLLDIDGYVAESSGSNIMFMKDDVLYIPNNRNMLCGCTQKFVESYVDDIGIKTVKDNFTPYDLLFSDGIIYCSTFSGLVPSYEVWYKGKKYCLNKMIGQNTFNDLLKEYSKRVNVDVRLQWMKWMEKQI